MLLRKAGGRKEVSGGGRVGVGEPEVLAAEAKNHEFAGLQARLDQVDTGVGLAGVEEKMPADRVGADLVGAAPVLADVELQVERRRLGSAGVPRGRRESVQ